MKKFIYLAFAVIASLWVTSASAVAPCSAMKTYADLIQAGTCYAGDNNSITFSDFKANIDPSVQSQVGVSFISQKQGHNSGYFGPRFDTSKLNYQGLAISFQAQCDQSCYMDQTVSSVSGGNGTGTFDSNGVVTKFTNPQIAQPVIDPTTSVRMYAGYTQTQVPNLAANSYRMVVVVSPTDKPSWPSSYLAPAY